MNATEIKPRLAHRRPLFDSAVTGGTDSIVNGIENALRVATERARTTGQRHVVTVSPYSPVFDSPGEPGMRVQAWR